MTELLILNEEHIPKLPRHAKLRFDEARNKWIINAPERVFELDDTAQAAADEIADNLPDGTEKPAEPTQGNVVTPEEPKAEIEEPVVDATPSSVEPTEEPTDETNS